MTLDVNALLAIKQEEEMWLINAIEWWRSEHEPGWRKSARKHVRRYIRFYRIARDNYYAAIKTEYQNRRI